MLERWSQTFELISGLLRLSENRINSEVLYSAERPHDGTARARCAIGEDRSRCICDQLMLARDVFRCHGLVGKLKDFEFDPGSLGRLCQFSVMQVRGNFRVRPIADHSDNSGLLGNSEIFRRNLR